MTERVALPRIWLAWVCYGVGHAIYVVFDQWSPWGICSFMFDAYENVMWWAHRLQGADPRGPWVDLGDSHD